MERENLLQVSRTHFGCSERRKRQPSSMQYKTSYIVYIVLTNIEHFLSEFENKSETFCCMFQSVRQGIFCQGIQASILGAEKGIRMRCSFSIQLI